MRERALLLTLVGLCTLASPAMAGNGIELLHQGAKASGRGGASTAVADDSLAVTRNPALLTQLRGARLDGGFIILGERVRERAVGEEEFDEHITLDPIPVIAFSTDTFALDVPLDDDPLDDMDYSASGPFLGISLQQPIVGVMAPTLSLAWNVTDTFAFGVSFHVLLTYLNVKGGGGGVGSGGSSEYVPGGKVFIHYQADGTPVAPPQAFDAGTGQQVTWAEIFDLADSGAAAPEDADDGAEDDNDGLQFELNDVFGAGIMASVGFLWVPRDDLSIGLAVRTPGIIFNPRGHGEIDLGPAIAELQEDPDVGLLIGSLIDTYLPDQGRNGYKTEMDAEADRLMVPASVSLGVAWWPVPRWLLAFDVRWIGWSHAMDEIELTGTGSGNRDLNEINGGSELKYTFRLEWRDQLVVALGTTVAVSDWLLLRGGFNYGRNPMPSSTATSSGGIANETHLTVGASLRLGDWDLDLAYIYGLPIQVRQTDSTFKSEEHQALIGFGYRF